MFSCTVNQLLRWVEDNRLERVLWVDLSGNGLYVIDISLKTALPRLLDGAFLKKAFSEGRAVLEPGDPTLRLLPQDSLSPKQLERRDSAWMIITSIIQSQPGIFTADQRGPLVRKAMKDHQVTKQTIYRLLRRYWQRGMTPDALLPDFYRSGAPGIDKPITGKKRGRPRKYGDARGLNVDVETRARFQSIVALEFARNPAANLATAYHELLDRYYSVSEVSKQSGRQLAVRLLNYPSMRQFRYWFERDNNIFDIERIRRTPRVYDKDMRALLGTSTREVFGPWSRYQIDATIADVYLVSRYDRHKIVGRPVLYVLVDVFSRMVVGIHAGFEGPSWVGAMMALANTAADKVEYCRQYGIPIEPQDWPCSALPEKLLKRSWRDSGQGD